MARKKFSETRFGKFIKNQQIGSKLLGALEGPAMAAADAIAPGSSAAAKAGYDMIRNKVAQAGYGVNPAGMRGMGAKKARKSKIIGTRRQVWHGTMTKTPGGLTKNDLMLNKRGRIVSKKKHAFGVTKGRKFLVSAGYDPKKGSFNLFPKKR